MSLNAKPAYIFHGRIGTRYSSTLIPLSWVNNKAVWLAKAIHIEIMDWQLKKKLVLVMKTLQK